METKHSPTPPGRYLRRGLIALILACNHGMGLAGGTPVGLWRTLDEDSGEARSLVRITENRGVLEGRIEKLLDPDEAADARCDRCTDERHKQPIVGLNILRNLRPVEGKAGRWSGGDILDPENGRVYRATLTLSGDGRQLDVRGYIGSPLFGRSQTWIRAD